MPENRPRLREFGSHQGDHRLRGIKETESTRKATGQVGHGGTRGGLSREAIWEMEKGHEEE